MTTTKYMYDGYIIEFKSLRDALEDCFTDQGDSVQVYIWNCYCEANNNPDDTIESMGEFNDLFYSKKPLEVIDLIDRDNFNTNHDWFKLDSCGRAQSSDDPLYDFIDLGDLLDWLEEHYQDEDIQDYFTGIVEVEEEEEDEEEEE